MSKKKNTFEENMSELQLIVKQLENGDFTLDESIKLFEKGLKLSLLCSKELNDVEKKISIMVENSIGTIEEIDFEGIDK